MDWTAVITASIAATPALLAWWEAHKAAKLSRANAVTLIKVEEHVNHLTDQRVEVQGQASHAEGVIAGIEKEQVRVALLAETVIKPGETGLSDAVGKIADAASAIASKVAPEKKL